MKKTIWILLDNRNGSRSQALGVANQLDKNLFEIITKEIKYTKLAALPNFIRAKTLIGLTNDSKTLFHAPFPDFVLSSSRRTAPVARFIKKQNPATKLIQLLHIGKSGVKEFSAVYVPEHDRNKYSAPNIKYTTGSPHFVTPEKLSAAQKSWQDKFAHLPHPLTALIIGGAIKKHPFSLKNAELLADKVLALKQTQGGSLLITTSRRTGKVAEDKIISRLNTIPSYTYLWGDKGDNPYLGFLACADNIIVTGDSVSMCCEATATNKPLQIFTGTDWLTKKHLRFVQSLYEQKYAEELSAIPPQSSTSKTLNIAKQIADDIKSLI